MQPARQDRPVLRWVMTAILVVTLVSPPVSPATAVESQNGPEDSTAQRATSSAEGTLLLRDVFVYPPSRQLVDAAVRGDREEVRRLVAEGAPVDLQGLYGITPLMWVVAEESVEGVRALLEAGADPNVIDDEGNHALHIAACLQDSTILEAVMVEAGRTDVPDGLGRTPLMMACLVGRPENARALIRAGAALAATDVTGMTALHIAALRHRPSICEMLVNAGADSTLADDLGFTPSDYAAQLRATQLHDSGFEGDAQ